MLKLKSQDRELILKIWQAGVKAVHPDSLIPPVWDIIGNLGTNTPIQVLGGGKAGAAMANALINSAPTWAHLQGIINVPDDQVSLLNVDTGLALHGSRPPGGNLPTNDGVIGSKRQLKLAASAPSGTFGICLLSGGASALMPLPVDNIELSEKLETTRLLQRAGADIKILNATRKHLSAIKGGRLAQAWLNSPSGKTKGNLWTFAISDVVNDDPSVIASGPTVADPTTFQSTWEQLKILGLAQLLPDSVVKRFRQGVEGNIQETPKYLPDQFRFHLIGNNRKAIEAASVKAIESNCRVCIFEKALDGPIEDVAERISVEILHSKPTLDKPLVLLWGGEPTVVVPPGSGLGGRNQELALRVGNRLPIDWITRTTVLCAGTDGEDGPTDAAGGIFDSAALDLIHETGFNIKEAIETHSSYEAHKHLGTLVQTGWTGTNVSDLVVAIIRA